jgi:glycosyltransferase involved in cell wall biosynthesis
MTFNHLLIDSRINGHNIYVNNWEELTIDGFAHKRFYAIHEDDYKQGKFFLLFKLVKLVVNNTLRLRNVFSPKDILVLHGTKNYIWLLPFFFAKNENKYLVLHESLNTSSIIGFLLELFVKYFKNFSVISVLKTSQLSDYIYLPPTVSDAFRNSSCKKFYPKSKFDFISIGNLNPLKGFDLILSNFTIGKWCSRYSIFGGEYHTQKKYVDFIKKLVELKVQDGLNISLNGQLQVKNVISVLSHHDILILPSRTEASPIVVLEALTLGMPVIASNVGDLGLWEKEFEGLFIVDFSNFEEVNLIMDKVKHGLSPGAFNRSHPIISGEYYSRFHLNFK